MLERNAPNNTMEIDVARLRSDIYDYYGTAAFNGFPAAIMNLADIERMSDQEIVDYAISERMPLEKYVIQE